MYDLNEAKEITDISFPQSWIDFYNDNDFASGKNNINSFISKNEYDQISKNIDKFIADNEINQNPDIAEADSVKSEPEYELIDVFNYTYDENNFFNINLRKNPSSNKLTVYAYCTYSENNIGLMQNDFTQIWMYPYSNNIDVCIIATVGNTSYSYCKANGKLLLNTIPLDSLYDIPENSMEQFTEMRTELLKFYQKYGIADSTENK